VSDPSDVRLIESVPQPVSGQPLQQAGLGSGHYLAEEFRFLAVKVVGLASERFTTIGVVSSNPSEGKTTVALGLTAALARVSEHRTLLLEADLRQPSVERYLGLPRTGGVSEFLAGRTHSVPVRTVAPPGFAVLAAGRDRLVRPELLGSDRMATLIGACQLSYGYVVIDCPPVLPVTDSLVLARMADTTLLVTSANNNSKRSLTRAVELLRQVDAPLVGTVLNSLSADETFSGEPYRYETVSRPSRHGGRRQQQPDHASNGGARRWDDEGDPDAEWDPVGPQAR
jgi:capsular exopolysaccharide synthesis family protein